MTALRDVDLVPLWTVPTESVPDEIVDLGEITPAMLSTLMRDGFARGLSPTDAPRLRKALRQIRVVT